MAGVLNTGVLALDAPTAVVIATGVATITQGAHTITSETGTTDDLATINVNAAVTALTGSRTLVLVVTATATHTITVKHGTGNIKNNSGADFSLTNDKAALLLSFDGGTNWRLIG